MKIIITTIVIHASKVCLFDGMMEHACNFDGEMEHDYNFD